MIMKEEPKVINAGEIILFKKVFSEDINDSTITYKLYNNSNASITLLTQQTDDYTVVTSISYAECEQLVDKVLTLKGFKETYYDGMHSVKSFYASTIAVKADDTRSNQTFEERALAAIEATLEGRATRQEQSYSIAGRSITLMSIKELLEVRDQLKAKVQEQKLLEKGQYPTRILARF